MNWKEIKPSADNTHFLINGNRLFDRTFIEVLKFHEPGIAPVVDETGAYHIDAKGKPLYAERYDRTFGYYCNRAAVLDNNRWFHIDENGLKVYQKSFLWTGNFQENLCTVRDENNQYFHIDLNGNQIYLDKYVYAGDFKDGIACVKLQDSFYRHIDNKGKFSHEKSFLEIGVYHKNFATAKDENGWFHIDKKGNALYADRYAFVEPFYNGQALVLLKNMKSIIINEKGIKTLSL